MARYRLFIGCSFKKERTDLRNYIKEQVEAHGQFIPIFGSDPSVDKGPAQKVRSLIETCNAALIIETADIERVAAPWIYSEIGMAYQARLPIFSLVDKNIQDTGITKYAISYDEFDPNKFTEAKQKIWQGLSELEISLDEMGPDIRSPENIFRKNIAMMLPSMIAGINTSGTIDPKISQKLRSELIKVLENVVQPKKILIETGGFTEKLAVARQSKQLIANYVYTRFLKNLSSMNEGIVLDSGTVTLTICEKLVQETCYIPIVTNNVAVGIYVSELPRYPCYILPGRLESRYLACLGDETDSYLLQRLEQGELKYGFIAATSFTSDLGIAGNDIRHASFKKIILEKCQNVIIVFEGEKITQEVGIPICSENEWRSLLRKRHKDIYIITHRPERWDSMTEVKINLYNKTIDALKEKLGKDNVIDLATDK